MAGCYCLAVRLMHGTPCSSFHVLFDLTDCTLESLAARQQHCETAPTTPTADVPAKIVMSHERITHRIDRATSSSVNAVSDAVSIGLSLAMRRDRLHRLIKLHH